MTRTKCFTAAALAIALLSGDVTAQTVTGEAFDNATVQPGGPRTGGNGKNFFNVQGVNNGNFASYGVADFQLAPPNPTAGVVNSLSLSFVQSNAAFTANGALSFYFAPNTTASIQPGGGLTYNSSINGGIATANGQLGDLILVGTGTFTQVANGTVDQYTFTSLSPEAQSYVLDRVNGGQTLRLVVTPDDATTPGVSATWAGFSNSTLAGPTISVDYAPVPEPASLTAVAVAVLAGGGFARRRYQRS